MLQEILPLLAQRCQARKRPLPQALQWTERNFTVVLAVDGSTLDSLLRKCGLLRDGGDPFLAGRMAALLDLITQ